MFTLMLLQQPTLCCWLRENMIQTIWTHREAIFMSKLVTAGQVLSSCQGLQLFFYDLYQFLRFVCVYYATILGFCMVISIWALGIIMLLRGTLFSKYVYGKAALWMLVVPCLFCGKLHLYFENRVGVRLFYWWYYICSKFQALCLIYITGGIILAVYLIRRRKKLHVYLNTLEDYGKVSGAIPIKMFPAEISSFCTGCFNPTIVVPENITDDQAEVIVRHEETHIKMGHLWIEAGWEIIRVLLWPNILLHICERFLKHDLEEVCDAVTIQRLGIDQADYGQILLDNARKLSLSGKRSGAVSSMSFAWDDSYRALRKRLFRITEHKPVRKGTIYIGLSAMLVMVFIMIAGIKQVSYARTNPMEISSVFSVDKMETVILDTDSSVVTHFDDEHIYIDGRELKKQYPSVNKEKKELYFGVGGYYKIPGIGGGGGWGFLDPSLVTDGIITIENHNDTDIWNMIIQWL